MGEKTLIEEHIISFLKEQINELKKNLKKSKELNNLILELMKKIDTWKGLKEEQTILKEEKGKKEAPNENQAA